jgi:UDP:flavonoid glycosyltransferase YjiC (YdhE family)
MKRALFTSSSGAGHLLPLIPIALAARDAGWDVVIAAPPESENLVTPFGIRFEGLDNTVPGDDPRRGAVFANFAALAEEERSSTVLREIFGYLNTVGTLDATKRLVAELQPDVIVSTYVEGSGLLAAELTDTPFAVVTPSLLSSQMDHAYATGLQRVREQQGMSSDVPDHIWKSPVISYWPQTMELESLEREVLRVQDPRNTPPSAPRDPERAFVTLGSEAGSFPFFHQMVQSLIDGVAATGMKATFAVGKHSDVSTFRAPDGIEVENWVDIGEALRASALVVHQCGSGITTAALATATPTIAVPIFADQPFNAERLQSNDAAVVIHPGPQLADDLVSAVSVLRDQTPPGLQKLSDEMAQHAPISAAVDLIERLAATR